MVSERAMEGRGRPWKVSERATEGRGRSAGGRWKAVESSRSTDGRRWKVRGQASGRKPPGAARMRRSWPPRRHRVSDLACNGPCMHPATGATRGRRDIRTGAPCRGVARDHGRSREITGDRERSREITGDHVRSREIPPCRGVSPPPPAPHRARRPPPCAPSLREHRRSDARGRPSGKESEEIGRARKGSSEGRRLGRSR